MKPKKRIFVRTLLSLTAAMVLFTACGKKDPDTETGGETTLTPTVSPEPTKAEEPSITPEPTVTTAPTEGGQPSPEPTVTTAPTEEGQPSPKPTVTTAPTEGGQPSPEPTSEPDIKPTVTTVPTKAPEPTKVSEPTVKPTQKPKPTPKPTKVPEATATPKPTATPEPTKKPDVIAIPTANPTQAPKPTEPEVTPGGETEPSTTPKPEIDIAEMSLEDIFTALYERIDSETPIVGNIEITKENESYYLGTSGLEFEEALASEAMMLSVPYSVCLVRMPEGSDIEASKKQIVEFVNPNKWICVGVEPENVLVGSVENVILLVMTRSMSQEIMDAFLSLQKDGEPAEILSQVVSPDKNGLLFYKGSCAKALGSYQETSAIRLGEKIESIYNQYLKGKKNVYYSVIPDKSFFIPNTAFSIDNYFDMLYVVQQNVKNATYIPLVYNLEFSDYYKSDLHWRQEELFPVLEALGSIMDFKISEEDFTKNKLQPYHGVYAPYMQENSSEELIYLTSRYTEEAQVEIYDRQGTYPVYLLEEWKSDVPYNLFLGGPNPLVTITNPSVQNGRELIIFGDSFMSSIAPLLTGTYEKITLVDLRFVMSSYLGEVLDFHGQDVLFLYNMAVVNESNMLK